MKSNLIAIKVFCVDYIDSTSTCRVILTSKIMLSIKFILFEHRYRCKRLFSYLNRVNSNSNNCDMNFSHSETFNYIKTYLKPTIVMNNAVLFFCFVQKFSTFTLYYLFTHLRFVIKSIVI